MKTSTIIVIVVLILVLMIGIGIWASKANAAPVIVTPTDPTKPIQPAQTDILGALKNLFTKWFGKSEPLGAYVQVQPVDADGCDALGYNRIGVRCDTGF